MMGSSHNDLQSKYLAAVALGGLSIPDWVFGRAVEDLKHFALWFLEHGSSACYALEGSLGVYHEAQFGRLGKEETPTN